VLLETDPKVVFCRTPTGDDSIPGLESQQSVRRFRGAGRQCLASALLFLVKTSPNGPPIEESRNIVAQFASNWLTSSLLAAMLSPIGLYSRLSLSGDSISFSWIGDVEADDSSEDAIGADIESCDL